MQMRFPGLRPPPQCTEIVRSLSKLVQELFSEDYLENMRKLQEIVIEY